MPSKTYSTTFPAWLRANCGKSCLAGLTSADAVALNAAVEIAAVWQYFRTAADAEAFGKIVEHIQPQMRFAAYHAIAHMGNWEDRAALWSVAGLPPLAAGSPGALYGPEGLERRREMLAAGVEV